VHSTTLLHPSRPRLSLVVFLEVRPAPPKESVLSVLSWPGCTQYFYCCSRFRYRYSPVPECYAVRGSVQGGLYLPSTLYRLRYPASLPAPIPPPRLPSRAPKLSQSALVTCPLPCCGSLLVSTSRRALLYAIRQNSRYYQWFSRAPFNVCEPNNSFRFLWSQSIRIWLGWMAWYRLVRNPLRLSTRILPPPLVPSLDLAPETRSDQWPHPSNPKTPQGTPRQ
jgi:hypothetical protein